MAAKEMVLYYQPAKEKEAGNASKAAKLKGVLIRMESELKILHRSRPGRRLAIWPVLTDSMRWNRKREAWLRKSMKRCWL